jgi:uncharacterized MAPEG superfamily protein
MTVYVSYRVSQVVRGRQPAHAWPRDSPSTVPGFVLRAQHAQLNCLENLPVFAAIVLVAYMLGRSAVVDRWSFTIVVCRLLQTTTHLIGVTAPLVTLRSSAFAVQAILFLYLIVTLACSIGGA